MLGASLQNLRALKRAWLLPFILGLLPACSGQLINNQLPPSTELSPPRSWRIARTIVHLHTPWSYDACDGKGTTAEGVVNESCLNNLRRGLCLNHVDLAFVTDHPSHMRDRTFTELLLKRNSDEILLDGSAPVANWMENCGDGHRPLTFVGFEGQLLGVGMKQHLSSQSLYDDSTSAVTSDITTTASGLSIVPHTEKWSVTDLAALGVNGIEVFNLHAQLDPKIRRSHLGLEPFLPSLDVLPYWFDPLQVEQPDLAFMAAGQRPELYERKWDELLSQGLKIFGTAGTDAHENLFNGNTRDGERIDSFRRIIRWVSNHLLVSTLSFSEAKSALSAGRFNLVFEALGTPVGVDFHAVVNGVTVEVGATQAFVSGQTRLALALPTLHPSSPRGVESPVLRLRILRVASTGAVQVAEATDAALNYPATQGGIYRAEIKIKPRHLSNFLSYDHGRAEEEYTWVLTNPIYLP